MLSESKVARAAPKEKPYKMADGGGLYLLISPAGGKLWRLNYRYGGKQKTLALGQWPVVPLQEAREKALEAKRKLKEGQDPARARQTERRGIFSAVANSWFERAKGDFCEAHARNISSQLKRDVLPIFAERSIDSITPIEVDEALKSIASKSVVMSYKAKSILNAIFTSAVFEGLCLYNPIPLMKGRLPKKNIQHYNTILDLSSIGQLLLKIDVYQSNQCYSAFCALRLLPLVFTRPSELRLARWSELDLEAGIWQIPEARMKMKNPHLVPLSRQAIMIFKEVREYTGNSEFVFMSRRTGRPFGANSLLRILEKLGYAGKISPHGFRAMARTLLHEHLGFSPDAVEAQLAHRVPDRLGATYNRSQHLNERKRMMQAWADFLDELKAGAMQGGGRWQ